MILKAQNKYSLVRGTSLIELMIYIGILAVMTLFIVAGIVQISQAFLQVRNERKVALAAESALERIVREIQLGTTLDTVTNTLVLIRGYNHCTECPNGISGLKGKKIEFVSNKIQLDTDTGDAVNAQDITPGDVKIEFPSISRLTEVVGMNSSHSKGLRITFTASAGAGKTYVSHKYYATAILRGSYEN